MARVDKEVDKGIVEDGRTTAARQSSARSPAGHIFKRFGVELAEDFDQDGLRSHDGVDGGGFHVICA